MAGEVQISLLPKVSEYLSLIMTLIFAFGLVFQLPVVTTLLARVGLVGYEGLKSKRKYAIVIAFIVAAVITPPDPVSQIGLALPTIILYEISIWMARLVEKKRAAADAEAQSESSETLVLTAIECLISPGASRPYVNQFTPIRLYSHARYQMDPRESASA